MILSIGRSIDSFASTVIVTKSSPMAATKEPNDSEEACETLRSDSAEGGRKDDENGSHDENSKDSSDRPHRPTVDSTTGQADRRVGKVDEVADAESTAFHGTTQSIPPLDDSGDAEAQIRKRRVFSEEELPDESPDESSARSSSADSSAKASFVKHSSSEKRAANDEESAPKNDPQEKKQPRISWTDKFAFSFTVPGSFGASHNSTTTGTVVVPSTTVTVRVTKPFALAKLARFSDLRGFLGPRVREAVPHSPRLLTFTLALLVVVNLSSTFILFPVNKFSSTVNDAALFDIVGRGRPMTVFASSAPSTADNDCP